MIELSLSKEAEEFQTLCFQQINYTTKTNIKNAAKAEWFIQAAFSCIHGALKKLSPIDWHEQHVNPDIYSLAKKWGQDRHAESEWAGEDGFRAEDYLTCGTFTGIPAFTLRLLTLWFGDFRYVCAWNSRIFLVFWKSSILMRKHPCSLLPSHFQMWEQMLLNHTAEWIQCKTMSSASASFVSTFCGFYSITKI